MPILLQDPAPIAPAQNLADLPPVAHSPIALAFVAGFLLWIIGGRLIRPAFAAMGIVLGGLAGFLLLPQLGFEQALGMPSPYAGLLFGGLSGLILAIVVFRTAVGVASAGAFALVGLLGGLALLQVRPELGGADPEPMPDERASALATDRPSILEEFRGAVGEEEFDEAERSVRELGTETFERLNDDTQTVMRSAYEQCRAFFDALVAQAGERWDATGTDERMILAGGTVLGAIAGLLIGFVAPRRSSAVVSALAGSAIWLASAVWLMHAFETPWRGLLDRSPLAWVIIWLAAAAIGVVLQAKARRAKMTSD